MEEVFYRKYRPMTFDDVRGQDHIIRALKNQICNNRLNHAYLFFGIRGTGKTTIARIFARAINCEHPINGNPCNECPTCTAILRDASLNVIEWDAASNGRIEDIRDIEQIIATRPVQGHYRVFIMDETQEMKPAAVNAFLKTLEEPPEYVVFILCTTDLSHMPQTIMSRCQQYNFKRMTSELVVDQLKMILNKEGRSIDERGLDHIAFLSEGSMRDAISLTNTVLSFSTNQHVDYDQVLRALQETSATDCDALVREINDGKSGEAIRIAKNMLESGITEEHLTADILRYLRDLLFINGENGIEIHASDTQRTAMEATAAIIGEKKITAMMLPFHDVLKEIRFLSSKELALEMAIMQASSRSEIEMYREVEERLSKLEDIMKN